MATINRDNVSYYIENKLIDPDKIKIDLNKTKTANDNVHRWVTLSDAISSGYDFNFDYDVPEVRSLKATILPEVVVTPPLKMYSIGSGEIRPFGSINNAIKYSQEHPKSDAADNTLNYLLAAGIAAPAVTATGLTGYFGDRLFHDAVKSYNGEDIDKNGMWIYNPGGWLTGYGVTKTPQAFKALYSFGRTNFGTKGSRLSYVMDNNIRTLEAPLYIPNIGWAPRLTISVTHKSNQASPLSLYNEQRWDVLNEGANPLGIWFQGKFGIPRSINTGATQTKAQKALKARQLFSRRPYTHSGDLTLDKPLITIGDVPSRSALSYLAEQMGADGIIYNNVYDNGYDANLVLFSFRHPDNYKVTARTYGHNNGSNEDKYLSLLGSQKENGIFKGGISDRSLVTRPFAEYLESLRINSSLFTEKDLNTLMQMRSKSVLSSIPKIGRSAIAYETKPGNLLTIFSIDINENGNPLGEIQARSHTPNHPRKDEVPVDMVKRIETSSSKGLSEDAYNAAIDYIKLTNIGKGLVSGDRLLSPEITYKVWEHYPNKVFLRNRGHHSFGYGRDVAGTGAKVYDTHEGPIVMLSEPSKTSVPMKSNHIFHPDMIKDGKLLPPDWTKYGMYYSIPLLIETYGMFGNKTTDN